MTALEMLVEPKETKLFSEKGTLNNNDSETIKDEFYRILSNVNDNDNTYEKRLEKLHENELIDRRRDFYNHYQDYNQNYADKSQNLAYREPETFEKTNEQPQDHFRNANEHDRKPSENSNTYNQESSFLSRENQSNTIKEAQFNQNNNARQNFSETKLSAERKDETVEIKQEKTEAKENQQVQKNTDNPNNTKVNGLDNAELKAKIQLVNNIATPIVNNVVVPTEVKTSVNSRQEVTSQSKNSNNVAQNANQHSIVSKNLNNVVNNTTQSPVQQTKAENTNSVTANTSIQQKDMKVNTNVKANETENKANQKESLAHIKDQLSNHQINAPQAEQTEKKALNITRANAASSSREPQTNAQSLNIVETVPNPEKLSSNNQLKQDNLINKQSINQVKQQNEIKLEHKNNDQVNTLRQEILKDSQKVEIKAQVETKPQKEQEDSTKVDINKHQIQQMQVQNKNLSEKSTVKHDINDNTKYVDTKDKSITTKIELQNNSTESHLDQKHNQQLNEFTAKINNHESHSGLLEINAHKTMGFDKILDSKDTKQTLSNSVMDQVINKATAELSDTKSQVIITLRPENLGKVDINLVSKDGVVTAQITAENSQVKDILNKGLETLRQNLLDQGVNVNKLAISVQETNTSNSNNNNSTLQQDQNFQKFEQANQNSSNPNQNSNSSRQTAHQERTNIYSNIDNSEMEENTNLTSNSSGQVTQGRVDYRV